MGIQHCNCLSKNVDTKQQLETGDKNEKKKLFKFDDDLNEEFAQTNENFVVARGGNTFNNKAEEKEKNLFELEASSSNLSSSKKNRSFKKSRETPIPNDDAIRVINQEEKKVSAPSFIAEPLDEDLEMEYVEKASDLFRAFNDLRVNPRNYESEVDPKLKKILREIEEDPVDVVLNSKKFFEVAFEYLNVLEDRKVTTSVLNDLLSLKINEIEEESRKGSKFSLFTFSYYRKPYLTEIDTLSNIFTQNLNDARIALTENFSTGFSVIIPCGKSQERVLLCLAKRK